MDSQSRVARKVNHPLVSDSKNICIICWKKKEWSDLPSMRKMMGKIEFKKKVNKKHQIKKKIHCLRYFLEIIGVLLLYSLSLKLPMNLMDVMHLYYWFA